MKEEQEREMGEKIKIGVCVMEKKVKCGSEVLLFLFAHFCTHFETRDVNKLNNVCMQ